jgi:chitinase
MSASFVSATTTRGTCGFTNGAVMASLGSVSNGASATITVKYTLPTSGAVTNLATVWHSAIDPNPVNNSALALLNVASEPALFIADTNVTQFVYMKSTIRFNVSLTGPSSLPVTVRYETANGTALAGVDYDTAFGLLTIPPGITNGGFNLNIIRPTVSATPFTFFYVNLSSPTNASLLRTQAIGTIITQNHRTVSVTNASVTEGNGVITAAQFKLRLNSTSAVPVAVQYRIAAGTATAGSDYQSLTGTAVIPPGATNLSLSVPVFGDLGWEPDESFSLLLSQPQNAFLAVNECLGTILNDDPVPVLNAQLTSGSLILDWVGGPYTLQASTNSAGPFTDVPAATSPYTNTLGTQEKTFFRLRIQ